MSSSIGDLLPGVYARVSSVVDWIKRVTSEGNFCKKQRLTDSPIVPVSSTATNSKSKCWGESILDCKSHQVGMRGVPTVRAALSVGLGRRPETGAAMAAGAGQGVTFRIQSRGFVVPVTGAGPGG